MAGPPTATSTRPPAASPAACAAGCGCAGGVPACFWTRTLLLAACIAVLLAVDQASKVYAMQHWRGTAPPAQPLSYLDGVFRIQYAENPGAFLSLFGGLPPAVRFWVLTVVNGVILAVVAGMLLSGRWPPDATPGPPACPGPDKVCPSPSMAAWAHPAGNGQKTQKYEWRSPAGSPAFGGRGVHRCN